jgi:DNA gyrase subunit A
MTLGRLSGLERQKIEDRLNALYAKIRELNEILNDEGKVKEIIKTELLEIKRKYADPRRTEIIDSEEEIDLEDLIPRHECVVTLTDAGYIKRVSTDTYSAQRRGGKGIIGMGTKEEDNIDNIMVANSHSYLLMFTDRGKIFLKKVYEIPESSRTAKGTNLINILEIEKGEKVTAMISLTEFVDDEYLVMVTRNGIIKRTQVKEYEYKRKGGKIAINLDDGDELIFVGHTKGDSDIIIATRNGQGARFAEDKVNIVGRTARGVRGIELRDDCVIGAVIVDDSKEIITLTENGFGKRSKFTDFESRNRGIFGVRAHNLNEKTGMLASIGVVDENKDIIAITNEGVVIRTSVKEIPVYNRSATGVKVMKLDDDAKIIKMTFTECEIDEVKNEEAPVIETVVEAEIKEEITENNEKTDTSPEIIEE